ncbi:hypothetical protein ACFV17_38320, partial [Streptomyces sp. NPDC059656]
FRIADEAGETRRRRIPRQRAMGPVRHGLFTTLLGGGHALSMPMPMPMPMLGETSGRPEGFFFTRESG